MEEKKYYYQVWLDVALKTDKYAFGMINISHIPYKKFESLFKDQTDNESFLFEEPGHYIVDEKLYKKNKKFFDTEIPFRFDYNLFEYSIGITGDEIDKYKKDYYDELPKKFKKRKNNN